MSKTVKLRFITILFLLLNWVFTAVANDKIEIREVASDKTKIKQTIDQNIRAHRMGDLAHGYDLLDSRSKAYFDSILDKVLHSSKEELQTLSFLDKVLVLQIRNQIESSVLKTAQGQDLYLYLNEISKKYPKDVSNYAIDEIKIDHDSAIASLSFPDDGKLLLIYMKQESEHWKINLLRFIEQSSEALENAFSGMNDQMRVSLLPTVIESLSRKPFDESSWNPVLLD